MPDENGKLFSDQNWKKLNMELYTMHMVTILSIPILRITIVREPQLSAGFAGISRNRGTLKQEVCYITLVYLKL